MHLSITVAVRAALLLCAGACFPAASQGIERGAALVREICSTCHGFPASGGPETVAGDATRIVAAFDKRPPMSSLRGVLSPADISDITEYLASLEPPAPAATPAHDATDLWWNAGESGWGFTFIQHPSHGAFGVLLLYDAANRPAWYSLSGGRWATSTMFVGRLHATSGPSYAAPTFDPGSVGLVQVGSVRFTIHDREHATLAYSLDNRLYTKAVTRLPF